MDFIEVYFCELSNNYYDNQLLTLVSDEKKESIKNKTMIDSKLSVYSDLFVRYLICNKYHLHNNELRFTKNKYGKPYLLNNQDIFFNISHTNNAFVVALSKEEIGVDIEKIRNINLKMAKRLFTELEQKYILSSEHKTKAFFELWTKKEAFIKYTGRNIFQLPTFSVFNKDIQNLINTIIFHKYIISVCSIYNSSQNASNIIQIRENELETRIKQLLE